MSHVSGKSINQPPIPALTPLKRNALEGLVKTVAQNTILRLLLDCTRKRSRKAIEEVAPLTGRPWIIGRFRKKIANWALSFAAKFNAKYEGTLLTRRATDKRTPTRRVRAKLQTASWWECGASCTGVRKRTNRLKRPVLYTQQPSTKNHLRRRLPRTPKDSPTKAGHFNPSTPDRDREGL